MFTARKTIKFILFFSNQKHVISNKRWHPRLICHLMIWYKSVVKKALEENSVVEALRVVFRKLANSNNSHRTRMEGGQVGLGMQSWLIFVVFLLRSRKAPSAIYDPSLSQKHSTPANTPNRNQPLLYLHLQPKAPPLLPGVWANRPGATLFPQ